MSCRQSIFSHYYIITFPVKKIGVFECFHCLTGKKDRSPKAAVPPLIRYFSVSCFLNISYRSAASSPACLNSFFALSGKVIFSAA